MVLKTYLDVGTSPSNLSTQELRRSAFSWTSWCWPVTDGAASPLRSTCHQLPQLGDLCGVEWRGSYARARVAALDTAPSTCRVLLIDFGNVETLQVGDQTQHGRELLARSYYFLSGRAVAVWKSVAPVKFQCHMAF